VLVGLLAGECPGTRSTMREPSHIQLLARCVIVACCACSHSAQSQSPRQQLAERPPDAAPGVGYMPTSSCLEWELFGFEVEVGRPSRVASSCPRVEVGFVLHGQVIDCDTYRPLEGLVVRAGAAKASSAPDGAFSLYVDRGVQEIFFDGARARALACAVPARRPTAFRIDVGKMGLPITHDFP